MSFSAQENVLFDLLFDKSLRERFLQSSIDALSSYDLDESELNDFKTIKPKALELDAAMRIDLVLAQFCRVFPISFSIISSFNDGIEHLKILVNKTIMQTDLLQRNTAFGQTIHQYVASLKFSNEREKNIIIAILEAELGMAWTTENLKTSALTPDYEINKITKDIDWLTKPIRLAAFVSASILPQPYSKLKQAFCSHGESELWHRLSKKPTSRQYRKKTLAHEDPRLLIAGATVTMASPCDPTIEHRTAELSEGFAPLFQHINGTMSVKEILDQLQMTGAQPAILESVKNGFEQLIDFEMLETI